MSLRKVASLGSNLASVTDLKRIQTPHSLCCDFGGDKTFTTRWSGCRVQVWVQVWAPAAQLAISPKAVPEGNRRFRGQNQWPSAWGSSPALLARVGRASTNTWRFWVGSSCRWQRPARLSLEEIMLLLLRYWLSSIGPRRFTSFFCHVKWNFRWRRREVAANQSSANRFAQSFYQSSYWSLGEITM